MSSNLLIRDVQEKEVGESKPPSFPQPTSSSTGFPEHKKRVRTSAFRRQNDGTAAKQNNTSPPPNPPNGASEPTLSFEESEKRRIDQENRAKLDDMSPEDIAKAQRDLRNGLDPAVIQMLLRRANLDDQSGGPSPFDSPDAARAASDPQSAEEKHAQSPSLPGRDATEATDAADAGQPIQDDAPTTKASKRQVAFNEDAQPSKLPEDLFPLTAGPPQSTSSSEPRPPRVHFPPTPQPPDLDPSDPDFLTHLHSKYFPTLPADPSKLAWMAPLPQPDTPADRASPYHPSNADESSEGLPAAALRFDFRGALLPPRLSRALPAHLGLHHHGDAPEAAGYTVAELARLARSAVPAQRCLAFQTLGRVAYRLGTGQWGRAAASAAVIGGGDDGTATQGRPEEDEAQKADNEALSHAIWESFEEGRVVETLAEAASVPEGQGHRGSRAYAIEALWLLEKGGWKPKATRQDA